MNRPSRLAIAAANALGWAADAALNIAAAPAENRRLREANRDLHFENNALSGIVNDLARQLAQAVNHPCVAEPPTFAQPVSVGHLADAMALLDADDCGADDLLREWGQA